MTFCTKVSMQPETNILPLDEHSREPSDTEKRNLVELHMPR